MLAPRFAGGLGAAVTTGMLAAATVPAQAAAMPGMGCRRRCMAATPTRARADRRL